MEPRLQGVHDSIQTNAALFLRRSVEEMMGDGGHADQEMSCETATMTCTLLQLAVELFMKAAIVRRDGLCAVVHPKEHGGEDLAALLTRFEANDLRTKLFWELKTFMKERPSAYRFSEVDWGFIDDFQRLRNKLVHIGYAFHQEDLVALRTDIVFVITHTLTELMADEPKDSPSEMLEPFLGAGVFRSLIAYPPYVDRMESLVRDLDGRTLTCWECDQATFSQAASKCLCCCRDWDGAVEFEDCRSCDGKESVVYDVLNIHVAGFINGLCLACGHATCVVRCPQCEYTSTAEYSETIGPQQILCQACDRPLEVRGSTGRSDDGGAGASPGPNLSK